MVLGVFLDRLGPVSGEPGSWKRGLDCEVAVCKGF